MAQTKNNEAGEPSNYVSNENYVRQIFALVQGNTPKPDYLANRKGEPPKATLKKILFTRYVASKVFHRFLYGSDREDRHRKDLLSDEIVFREAARLIASKDDPGPPIEVHQEAQSSFSDPGIASLKPFIIWRYAFFLLWNCIGSERLHIVRRIGRAAEGGQELGESILSAIEFLEEIDALVSRGDTSTAILLIKHNLDKGFTYAASRYLALSLRLCADPTQIEQIVGKYGMYCSARFVENIREDSMRMLDPAFSRNEGDGTANSSIEPYGIEFAGELPAVYDFLPSNIDWMDPARMTLWSALQRPVQVPAALHNPSKEVTVVVRLDSYAEKQDTLDLSCLSAILAEGLNVIAVVGDCPSLFQSLQTIDGLGVVEDMIEACTKTKHSNGPVLIYDDIAPIPADLFMALAACEPDQSPIAVAMNNVRIEKSQGVRSKHVGRPAIRSWDSRFSGIYAPDASEGWDLLADNGQDPAAAAAKLIDAGRNPIQIFSNKYVSVPDTVIDTVSIAIRLGDNDSPIDRNDFHTLDLPGSATGEEVAEKLIILAEQEALQDDTPVSIQSSGFTYDAKYLASIVQRYELYARELPIAVRGLRIRQDNARPEFFDTERHYGLIKVAPLGLSCISLGMAVSRLREWGDRPACDCVVAFDPAAAAWTDGRQNVRGAWGLVLERLEADPNALNDIFVSSRQDLGGAIAAYERGDYQLGKLQMKGQVGPALPVPFQIYSRAQETTKEQMTAALHPDFGYRESHVMSAADSALRALLTNAGLRTLLEDGHGIEVRAFLDAIAPGIGMRGILSVANGRELLDLAEACGLQATYARALAPAALSFCDQDPNWIAPLFQYLVKVLGGPRVMPILFASLSQEAMGKARNRNMNRLSQQIAETCDVEDLELSLSLLDEIMGERLTDCRDTLQIFGRRLLATADPVAVSPLPRSGICLSDCIALAEVETHLHFALSTESRKSTLAALRRISEEDGTLNRAIETTRLLSAEASQLGITSDEWRYPFYADRDDTMVMATILGDAKRLRDLGLEDEPSKKEKLETVVEYDHHRSSGSSLRRAVGRMVLGDAGELTRIFAGWARAEGIRPLNFIVPPSRVPSSEAFKDDRVGGAMVDLFEAFAQEISPNNCAQHEGLSADIPKISAIITTFNADPALLRLSLTSILAQSWPSIEIIVVDDGSCPELRDAAKELAALDPRISFFDVPVNGGPYLARNLALEWAEGSFIAIQDADDYSHPDRFARQVARLQERPDALACEAGHMRFDRNGRPQFLRNLHIVDDGPMSTMFRREAFDRLGPFAATRSRGDVEYRERIRQSYGPRAFDRTPCPMVFCFGAPGTLSQRVVRQTGDALKAFRQSIGLRRWVSDSDGRPVPLGALTIPAGLRP